MVVRIVSLLTFAALLPQLTLSPSQAAPGQACPTGYHAAKASADDQTYGVTMVCRADSDDDDDQSGATPPTVGQTIGGEALQKPTNLSGTPLGCSRHLTDENGKSLPNCPTPDPSQPARPQLTTGMIQTAFRSVPVPSVRSQVQPAGKTLVNFDTIFYCEAESFVRTVNLLGYAVDLRISPVSYTWNHGDGTTATTAIPGAKFPAKDVVHRYQQAHVTVQHSVDVTWGAEFRVDDGAWAPVEGTVTVNGPVSDLRIAEATPVLTSGG